MQKFRFGANGKPPARIVCIGAHCDDIEIGCGGLLIELCRSHSGISIDWFVASAEPQRAEETRRAAQRLLSGCRSFDLRLHEFADGFLPYSGAEVKRALRSFAREAQADLVLTHSLGDAHQDHRFIAELTWQTFREHLILEYEIPKYDGDLQRPNWFVPLSQDVVERKIECLLECFVSQHAKPWFDRETFRGLMRLRGVECHAPSGFAEGFHLRKGLWQIS